MPPKEHLPSVSSKEQRMYEHIKASERKDGRSLKRAKTIAAATVVKHHRGASPQVEVGGVFAIRQEDDDANDHH